MNLTTDLQARVDQLETENAELRARLERVEFVLRNLATAAAFVDHPGGL